MARPYVQYELRTALELGKKIVLVHGEFPQHDRHREVQPPTTAIEGQMSDRLQLISACALFSLLLSLP